MTNALTLGQFEKMSHSRLPFAEAQKRLTISCIHQSVRRKLALHLDTHHPGNWQYLAEQLELSPLEIEWVKNTANGSQFFRFFEIHLVHSERTLEEFVYALEKIKNLACIKVLNEEYEAGSFDTSLNKPKICTSITEPPLYMHISSENYISKRCPNASTCCSGEHLRPFFDSKRVSTSSGETFNSTCGVNGDTTSYMCINSNDSLYQEPIEETPVPVDLGICRQEYKLSSVSDKKWKDGALELSHITGHVTSRVDCEMVAEHFVSKKKSPSSEDHHLFGHLPCGCCHRGLRNGKAKNLKKLESWEEKERQASHSSTCLHCGPDKMPVLEGNQEVSVLLRNENFGNQCRPSCCCVNGNLQCQKNDFNSGQNERFGGELSPSPFCNPEKRITNLTVKENMKDKKEKSTDCDSALIQLLCVHG